jgi:hypothetical protein
MRIVKETTWAESDMTADPEVDKLALMNKMGTP